jgi:DNA ligase-1
MQFDEFAERAEKIESLSGDHETVDKVASLLSDADEVCVAVRFAQGRVFPAWDDRKIDVGPSLLYDALSLAGDATAEEIEKRVAETGDIGDVAHEMEFSGQQTFGTSERSLSDVYASFERLASKEGEGSQETKTRELGNLFMDASPNGAKYLARLVLGEMRLGVGEGTVRDAVVEAFDVDAELVERGIMLTNDTGEVAEVARDDGDEGLASLEMVVGRPVKPMLAQTTTVENVFADLDANEAIVQTKYDGARVQLHFGDETRIFSRSLEDLTDSLPDIVERVDEVVGDGSHILDAEIVAVGDEGPLPFQEVLRRIRRKYRVEEMRDEVELELYVFDILYDDGAVIDEILEERTDRLSDAVEEEAVARTSVVGNHETVRREENTALELGHEGVVVKKPGSTYSPGRRGKNWLKIKPEPETLDLVVTGGEWGEGRRASLVGSYLLSVLSEDDGYETVGKVATGLTDERLEELTERFVDGGLVISEDGKEIQFKPAVVFEVGYEEIQSSPVYSSGYALRFPRFLGVRDDKSVEDADTVERLERIYEEND